MKAQGLLLGAVVSGMAALAAGAADWPQWRGLNRDARVTGFDAPKSWPKELTQKWKVAVGEGVATPSLVGDKLYVFSRQSGNEILRCLDAATGKELWQDKYESGGATGPAAGFSGPRCSPTVADGKVVTLGVRGIFSCYSAATGKKLWRKEDKGSLPRFFVSSSPIVVDGLVIAELGGQSDGVIAAFDLASGEQKWKWTGDGAAYASPTLLTVDGTKVIVVEMDKNIVGIGVADGKLLWKTPFAVSGRGYNAAGPMVDGQTVIYSGSSRGTRAVKLEKSGDGLAAKELWNNPDESVQFNTPVLKDGLIYGLSERDSLFCLDAATGKADWTAPIGAGAAGGGAAGGGGGGRMRGRPGYGSIVDCGPVLMAMTPATQLIVFEPSAKEFKQVAKYKVGDSDTYAYPVVAGNRVYVKDKESVILWVIE